MISEFNTVRITPLANEVIFSFPLKDTALTALFKHFLQPCQVLLKGMQYSLNTVQINLNWDPGIWHFKMCSKIRKDVSVLRQYSSLSAVCGRCPQVLREVAYVIARPLSIKGNQRRFLKTGRNQKSILSSRGARRWSQGTTVWSALLQSLGR